jgi:hypothetical protein
MHPNFDGHAFTHRTRITEHCLRWSRWYYMQNTFKCRSSLFITQLLYAAHLYQSSVCASNTTISTMLRTLLKVHRICL